MTTKGGAEIASYTTDASGTLLGITGQGAAAYTHDPFGRLAAAEVGAEVTYAYDALDRTTEPPGLVEALPPRGWARPPGRRR